MQIVQGVCRDYIYTIYRGLYGYIEIIGFGRQG